jgi:HEAT repeat protein
MAAGQAVLERAGPLMAEDPEADARERAVFAMSQLPRDESIPALIDVARTHRDPRIRKAALFWLGQTEDPRAMDVLEEVLRGG